MVNFQNELPESARMNRFVYEYFYNGGGVAIGDVNGDGLADIFFTSNLNGGKLFLNEGQLSFTDITKEAGLDLGSGWTTGVAMADINQDGRLDIYICRAGRFADANRRRNKLFINHGVDDDGIPQFEELAGKYGLDDEGFGVQASFLDYDLDGDIDVFLANHNVESPPNDLKTIEEFRKTKSSLGGNKLYENRRGVFVDATEASGIASHKMNYSLGVAIGDVNDDSWPDIYVANDYSEPDHLYLNNGDGSFRDVAQYALAHMPNFSMGCDMADLNNDGLLDIVALDMVAKDNYGLKTSMSGMDPDMFWGHVESGLHHQYMYNALQINMGQDDQGRPLFSEIAQMAGVSSTDWSWAPLVADFDNDGFKDLFITNGIKRDFRNNDFNQYLRRATDEVISERKNPLSYYMQWTVLSPMRKKSNYLFRNDANLRFSDMTEKWNAGHPVFSNGASYGDLDNDGDLDLVVNNIDTFAFVYENLSNLRSDNHFLSVKLEGPAQNRSGLGARIKLLHGESEQTSVQYLSRGYQSSVSEVLLFGLGVDAEVDQLVVTWPDGKGQKLEDVSANQQLVLRYKDAVAMQSLEAVQSDLFFSDITGRTGIGYQHEENPFNDFEREVLLPHKMSQLGPALSVGDVNGDGVDDLFVGGAKGYSGVFYLQKDQGKFEKVTPTDFNLDKEQEDVGSLLFDADGDGDLDLYVVSGGNEKSSDDVYYLDRFYENDRGNFRRLQGALPTIHTSGSCAITSDFDSDGDLDLFVGGRQVPGHYPNPARSQLLRNDSNNDAIKFTDVTDAVAPALVDIGMVSGGVWTDFDTDGDIDLMLVGEWMSPKVLRNQDGVLVDITDSSGLADQTGWWSAVVSSDFDGDGDEDFIAGNLGLNYKYHASHDAPFEIYAGDFDDSGSFDIVLGYDDQGVTYPLRGRQCSAEQVPSIKKKFPSYDAFARADLTAVYGSENLSQAINYKATNFATCYVENLGGGKFEMTPLENLAQITSTNAIQIADVNSDGQEDLILFGNQYESEVETPRNDAGYGLCLLGDGHGKFSALMPFDSGLLVKGEVRNVQLLKVAQSTALIVARNEEAIQIIRIETSE